MAVTLRDIAKRLNLSHATVSFVLNDRRDVTIPEATRRRVMDMAKEMGYRPNRAARALVSGRTSIIGVWIPSIQFRFYAEVLDTVSLACRRAGYETLFHRAYLDDGRRPFDWPIDGVLAVDVNDCIDNLVESESIPLVCAGAYVHPKFDSVEVDLRSGARTMASHLIEVGGKRLVMLKLKPDEDGRDEGYAEAVLAAGGKPDFILANSAESGRIQQAVREYVRHHGLPDGIFSVNDNAALATKRALADLGYYPPRDIVLGGFDGIHDAEAASISTMAQPVKVLADRAVEMLIERIQNPTMERRHELLQPELLVRDTSARLVRIAETA